MIDYANESVIKALRQYDMLLKSLKFIGDDEQRYDTCMQMTRIIEKVLDITNSIYEEKYQKIVNRSTYLMDEEKNRLLELINLINERRAYVNNQITNNAEVTGLSFDVVNILGEDKIEDYKNQVKVIDKYKNNIRLDGVLKDEIANLEISIKKAKDKINNNKLLNKQLENKMIKLLDRAFSNLGLFELQERVEEIDLAYTELGYSLEEAKKNAKRARKEGVEDFIIECDNLLSATTLEYERYKEKKFILRLIDIYKIPCEDYDSLLKKREEINGILNSIVSSDLYESVGNELNKEYATIKLEQQDVATLNSLLEEKESKSSTLLEINRENDSEEFKSMLSNLLDNEKKYQEKKLLEKKKKEVELMEKKKQEEQKMQEEILKRQKMLEEERKKEIERRTKQLLDEKKNPVLVAEKDEKTKKVDNLSLSGKDKSIGNGKKVVGTRNLDSSNLVQTNMRSNVLKSSNNNEKSVNLGSRSATGSGNRDIFEKVDEKKERIPVIRNNDLNNNVVEVKEVDKDKEIFPKIELSKEEDIFPKFPEKNDSFFDESEFKDLNKYMEGNSSKDWF